MTKAVVVGATGGVGRFIVKALALRPDVSVVTAIVRKEVEGSRKAKYFHLEGREEVSKIVQRSIDYDGLHNGDADAEKVADEVMKGHTIGLSGLGLYTGKVSSESQFEMVDMHYNVAAAKAMLRNGVKRYAYLSGQGVTQDPGFFTPMFARVKGKAESALQSLGFETATMARPGGILDRGEDALDLGVLYRFVERVARAKCLSIKAEDLAKAMVWSTMASDVGEKEIWELKTLHQKAAAATQAWEDL